MSRETHNLTNHKLYGVWQSMRQRCNNPDDKGYKSYGAKGVTVCEEWDKSFTAFYEWCMSNGYREGLELDKDILSNKLGISPPVYSPNTCMFVSPLLNRSMAKRRCSRELSEQAKMGWKKKPFRHINLEKIDDAIECYGATNISVRELSEKSGFARETLTKHLVEAGYCPKTERRNTGVSR